MVQRALATLTKVPIPASVGDVFSVWQAAAAHPAISASKENMTLRGFVLEGFKDQATAPSISLLRRAPALR